MIESAAASRTTSEPGLPSGFDAIRASDRRLADYDRTRHQPGRGGASRLAWYVVSLLVFESGWVPISALKVAILRRFGARIGRGVVIKPHVRIKYPWRLTIGDHAWIGQGCWIDNLAEVSLADNVCVSQAAYLCTGSHDYRSPEFDLLTRPIRIGSGAWICARAVLLPGVEVERGAVVAAGAVVTGPVGEEEVVAGNPAVPIRSVERLPSRPALSRRPVAPT